MAFRPSRTPPAPRLTAAEIAGRVPKPPRLQLVEQNLASLRARRDALQAEASALEESAPSRFSEAYALVAPRLREIATERRELDAAIAAARRGCAAAREQHVASVVEALAPSRERPEQGIAAAFLVLLGNWTALDEIDTEVRKVGGAPSQHPSAIQLKLLFGPLVRKTIGDRYASGGQHSC